MVPEGPIGGPALRKIAADRPKPAKSGHIPEEAASIIPIDVMAAPSAANDVSGRTVKDHRRQPSPHHLRAAHHRIPRRGGSRERLWATARGESNEAIREAVARARSATGHWRERPGDLSWSSERSSYLGGSSVENTRW